MNTKSVGRGLVSVFIGLCLLHYFSARELWLDEAFVYKNLLKDGYLYLFGPLDPVQSFPRLYLVLIKLVATPFDLHVLALRLPSLLCMLGSVFLIMKIFRADFRDDIRLFLALLAICASYQFAYYGAELKPYSMDVLVVALHASYFHYQRVFEFDAPKPKDLILAALLPMTLFFSYASLFVFWIVSFNFLLQWRKNRKVWPAFLVNAVVSVVCFGLFYYFDIRHSVTKPGVEYWDGRFMCYETFGCFWDKLGEGIRRLVIYPFYGIKALRYAAAVFIPFYVFAVFVYGSKRLVKDRIQVYHSDSLSLLLFIELFVLGSFRLYPFTGDRLTLFLSPFVIYMTVKGLTGFIKWPKVRKAAIGYFLVFYLMCFIRTIYLLVQYY